MSRLKELRIKRELTQQQLVDELNETFPHNEKPFSKMNISNWENGKHNIKPEKAQQLADYFGVSVGYLLGYEVIDVMETTNLEDYIFFTGDYSNPDKTRSEYFEKISQKIITYKKVVDSLHGRYDKNQAIEVLELLKDNGEDDLDDIFELLRDKLELALFRYIVQYQLLSTKFHHLDSINSKDKILDSFKDLE